MTHRVDLLPTTRALAALLVLAGAVPAFAVDGVVEINQVCATQTGCVPTDASGFPVAVPAGSYRLTSNLDLFTAAVPENTSGVVLSDGATLDMNGFSIVGTTVCSGEPPGEDLTCAPVGTGLGVAAGDRVTVINGSISGTGSSAIFCGEGCIIEGLRVENSGATGIIVRAGSVVRKNTVSRNRFNGISFADQGGLVIQGNTVLQNGSTGIFTGIGDLVEGNVVKNNRGVGILANFQGVVRGNVCVLNGSHGILGGSRSRVSGNTASENGGFGLQVSGAFDNNTVEANTLGTTNGGVDAGGNVCGGTLGCP